MFRFTNSLNIILGGVLLIIILLITGLSGWIWYQSGVIDELQTEKGRLEQNQAQLTQQLQAEQRAVEKQRQVADELRTKTEQAREKVKVIFKDSPCAHTALPRGTAEQLR